MDSKGNVLMQKYDFGRLLGKGNFAKVYYGRDLTTGQSVAIKVIDKEKILKVGLIDQTKREISAMGMVKHPNIVRLYEVLATKTKVYFVMEYAKGGEVFTKLSKGKLKTEIARSYFQQLIRAVEFCHNRGVYHRDLKLENLLLDENDVLKVADFGLSAFSECKKQDGLLHTTCGTPAYVAPEVLCRKGYDGAKSDIWSCGVILYVLLSGHLPFQDSNLINLYKKIGQGRYKCPFWFSFEVQRLLSRMLDPNPSTRISIAKIKKSSWFRKGWDCGAIDSNMGQEKAPVNADTVFGHSEDYSSSSVTKLNMSKPANFNAFDIISLSSGFDLSGLFVSNDQKEEVQFTSTSSATSIISILESVAKGLNMKMMKNQEWMMKLEASNENLSIDIEIFEIAPSFHLVEVKKSNGDSVVFQKLVKQDFKSALKEIIWAWQGERQH